LPAERVGAAGEWRGSLDCTGGTFIHAGSWWWQTKIPLNKAKHVPHFILDK